MPFLPLIFAPADEFEESTSEDGSLTLSAAVSVSEDDNRVVTVNSALTLINANDRVYEFTFAISVVSLDDSIPAFETQDRTIAKAYIAEESHPYILPTVVIALTQLVNDVQPQAIYRVTKMPNLPIKAMTKHELLTETLQGMNYEITDSGTDGWNRRFWKMQKIKE